MLQNLSKRKHLINILIISLLLWILVGFVLYPTLKTLRVSLTDDNGLSLANYIKLFTTDANLLALRNTLVLGLLTVLICGLVGTALAFLVNYFDLPFKKLIDKLLMLPLVLPGLIIVFSFVQLYGESGLITKTLESVFNLKDIPYHFSGLGGILFVHAYTQYIYFYMNVSVGIKQLDQSVIEAARNLGASKFKVFTGIILPFLKPALLASSIVTFMTGVGSFSAPSIIGGSFKVMTTQILLAKANNYLPLAAAQVVLLLFVSMTYMGILRLYENKNKFTTSVKGVPIQPVKIKSKWLKILMVGVSVCLVVMVVLPIVTIVVLSFVKPGTWMIDIYPREFSFDNYLKIFTKRRALAPFVNSLMMSSLTVLMCIFVALPASYLMVKTKVRIKGLIELLIMLPWAMPASAIAINMINAFNKPTPFTFNQGLIGRYMILPLAYFVSLLPLMVRSTSLSLRGLNDTYLEVSKNLGADSKQTFKRVIVPIISPGIVAGMLLVFIRSLGEYTISAFLYTASNKPISIAMVNGIFEYQIGLAMAYGALIVALALAGSVLIRKFSTN